MKKIVRRRSNGNQEVSSRIIANEKLVEAIDKYSGLMDKVTPNFVNLPARPEIPKVSNDANNQVLTLAGLLLQGLEGVPIDKALKVLNVMQTVLMGNQGGSYYVP